MRSNPFSVNMYLPAEETEWEEVLTYEQLASRYLKVRVQGEVNVGDTYETYAGMGVYISNRIIKELK